MAPASPPPPVDPVANAGSSPPNTPPRLSSTAHERRESTSSTSSVRTEPPATLNVEPGSPSGLHLQFVDPKRPPRSIIINKKSNEDTLVRSPTSYFDFKPRTRSSSAISDDIVVTKKSDIIVASTSPSAVPYRFPLSLPSPWDWASRSPLSDRGPGRRPSLTSKSGGRASFSYSEAQKQGRPSMQSRASKFSIYSLDEKTECSFHPTSTFEDLHEAIPNLPDPQPHDFPDGGQRAWLTVLGACLVQFSAFGNLHAWGVFQDFYSRELLSGFSAGDISWIGSVQIFLVFAMSLFTGQAFDAGYFRHCIATGTVLYLICSLCLSFVQPGQFYQVLLAQGIGKGLALGLMFLPSIMITCHHFLAKRAFVMGLVFTAAGLGAVFFPTLLNHTIHKGYHGFAWSMRASTLIHVFLLGSANLLMRTRLGPGKPPGVRDLISILTDVPYVLSIIGTFLTFWGGLFPLFYVQLFATRLNISWALAFYSLPILNAASLFGRIIPNLLSDKYGTYIFMIPTSISTSVAIFSLLGFDHPDNMNQNASSVSAMKNEPPGYDMTVAGLVLFLLVYGLISGSFLSLTFPLFASHAKAVDELGLRMGIAFTVLGIAGLTGSPIAGALLTTQYKWWQPILFSGLTPLAGTVLLIIARSKMVKSKRTPWV